jgi:hypothetical protein
VRTNTSLGFDQSDSLPTSRCPFRVDAVDKVGDEQRASNNRIQVPRSLNQCCAPDSYLETMLLTRPRKTFFDSIGQKLTM